MRCQWSARSRARVAVAAAAGVEKGAERWRRLGRETEGGGGWGFIGVAS
jgi:hypothetical protein